MGVFDRLFEAIASQPDLEWLMIDATVIRAQAQAAGARRKEGDRKPRLSVARAASSARKLHAVVDALGLPVRFAIGPGQQETDIHGAGLWADREECPPVGSSPIAPTMRTSFTILSSTRRRRAGHFHPAVIAMDTSTPTTKSPTRTAGESKASSPSSSSGGVSPRAMTNWPQASLASLNSPVSCSGSND